MANTKDSPKDRYTTNVQCISQTAEVYVIPKKDMLEFRKKNQYAAFWQQVTRISAEIVQKRAEKLMENEKVKTLINSSFK